MTWFLFKSICFFKQDSKKSRLACTGTNKKKKKNMYERYNIPQPKPQYYSYLFWTLCLLIIFCIIFILFLPSSKTTVITHKRVIKHDRRIIDKLQECSPNITHWVMADETNGFFYCSENSVWEYITDYVI